MYRFFIVWITVACSINVAFAQKGGGERPETPEGMSRLVGRVMDESEQPLSFASVVLYQDSALIKGSTTNEEGRFMLLVDQGTYELEISFLSFQTIRKTVELTEPFVRSGKVILKPDEASVENIVVEGEKNLMEIKLDKRVFNVQQDPSNKGRDASEILDNLPSVEVDMEGNVSLRGSQNVRILIDGKPSALVGGRNPDGLRQLQGEMIESVEVITNPSARYDAEGEVGIINIVLKKGRKKGFNGNVNATVGYPENFGLGLNLNFRYKKVNFFTNLSGRYRVGPGQGSLYQRSLLPDGSWWIYESDRKHSRGGFRTNAQVGTEFFIDDHQTLTLSGSYRFGDGNNSSQTDFRDFDDFGNLISSSTRTETEDEIKHNVEAALSYTKTFKKKGQKFVIDMQWIQGDDTEIADYLQTFDTSVVDLHQRANNTEDQIQWLFQTDYIHPVGKDGKLETGLKATLRNIENDYTVEEQTTDGAWFVLDDFNDLMRYKEHIYAGYLMYGNKYKKFSYQLGLRGEYSDIETKLVESNQVNPRKYFNVFPSGHFSIEFKEMNYLQWSYSYRLSRPGFRSLLPFFTFSNNRSLWTGNPDLDPEFTHSSEIGYLKYFKKGSFLASVYYRYTTGAFEWVRVLLDDGTTASTTINLSDRHAVGLELNTNYTITKWWKLNASANLYRAESFGVYEGDTLTNVAYTANARASFRFDLPKAFQIQTSGRFRAPSTTTQGKRMAIAVWDLSISKDLFNERATLTLNVQDVLNTRRRRSIIDTEELYSDSVFQWRARQIVLSFSYRINQKKKRGRRGQGGGFEEGGF